MRDVVLCAPVRTAVGRYGGALSSLSATQLGTIAVKGLLERSGVDPSAIDELILGQGFPSSEGPAIGRVVALDAGLPVEVTGIQIDRRCGSGLQAILYAIMQVQSGANDVVVAGGVESMSNAIHYSTAMRRGARLGDAVMYDALIRGRITAGGESHPVPGGMIETAENLRRAYAIPREEQDAFAVRSHQRAIAAQQAGRFDKEIIPVTIPGKTSTTISVDEHPRPDANQADMAVLTPLMAAQDPDSTVTAGNACGQNDAAAMTLVADVDSAARLGITPMLRLRAWAVAGVEPKMMGIGPVPASTKALAIAELRLSDMDLIEVNEAFAAQVLACTRAWNFVDADFGRLNVNGSGISLGHPVGATGARILATLAYEMERRNARYALETMCIGGGQGIAAVFERVAA